MPLSKEQLLIDRYKVIAPMPFGKFEVGDILMHLKCITRPDQKEGELIWRVIGGRFGGQSVGIPMIKDPDKYPHLFQKLEWWEERDESELPKYIKFYMPLPEGFSIRKVGSYEFTTNGMCIVKADALRYYLGSEDKPSTEEEFNSLNNK